MTYAPHMRQIKASAGSGKTHDITGRFLDYLGGLNICSHKPSCTLKPSNHRGGWADILAITFTNAAATEMKERVLERLKKIALGTDEAHGISPSMAKAWVSTILRQYGALNIRTIDSLLHRIVRTAALDLGLPPDFETSFTTNETLEPIFDILMERAWQEDELIISLLEAICYALLMREKSYGFSTGGRIIDTTRPLLEKIITNTLPEISSKAELENHYNILWENFLISCTQMLELMTNEDLQLKKNVFETIVACTRKDKKAPHSAWLRKSCLSDLIYAKHKDKVSQDAKDCYKKLTKATHDFVTHGHIIQKALEWLPFVNFTKLMANEVHVVQQQEHKIPATSIPKLAKEILNLEYGGVSAALCRLGSGIHHILLDEFQDTSIEQWEALRPLAIEALSGGGSITWVGDIKQAIYGWRGGNSTLFDALCTEQELRCMVPEVDQENLPTNWRSREQVVMANNKLFQPLSNANTARPILQSMLSKDFPCHILDNATQKLCHAFVDVAQQVKPENYAGGFVSIEDVGAENAEELSQAVHDKLFERMQDLRQRRAYGDITILTRSNSGAARVAAWLMDWGIPVITENSLLLNNHPLVQESLALLNFLNTPHDNLSFWTVLSGSMLRPYLGQDNYSPSVEQLHELALQNEQNKDSLNNILSKEWPEFWNDIFAPFYNTAQLVNPYDTLQEWYRILHVNAHFAKAEIFLRRFLEVVHMAAERGHITMGAFLDYWSKHGHDEKAPMPSKINAVQIMTIHKSKGLQFKVVIIPWSSFSQQDNNPPPVHHCIGNLSLLAPRCKQMGDIFYENQAEQALEAINVFYVACTRAEEELHIFNTHTPALLKMRNLACALELLLPSAGFTLPLQLGLAIEDDEAKSFDQALSENKDIFNTEETRLSPSYISRPMQWLPRLKIFRNPLQELRLSPRLRGLLTHHCLEQFKSTGQAEKDAEYAVKLGLRTFALPITQSKELYDELVKAITWYATLPQVQHWSKHGLTEQSIMDNQGNVWRVDLLLRPSDVYGWRVIEFKTGQEHPDHINQLRNYLNLLDNIKQDHLPASEGGLIYLDLQKCRMVGLQGHTELTHEPMWGKTMHQSETK